MFECILDQKQTNEKTGDHPSRAELRGVDRHVQIRSASAPVLEEDGGVTFTISILKQRRGFSCLLNSEVAHGYLCWTNSEARGQINRKRRDNQLQSIFLHFVFKSNLPVRCQHWRRDAEGTICNLVFLFLKFHPSISSIPSDDLTVL